MISTHFGISPRCSRCLFNIVAWSFTRLCYRCLLTWKPLHESIQACCPAHAVSLYCSSELSSRARPSPRLQLHPPVHFFSCTGYSVRGYTHSQYSVSVTPRLQSSNAGRYLLDITRDFPTGYSSSSTSLQWLVSQSLIQSRHRSSVPVLVPP